jgi:hemolysin III
MYNMEMGTEPQAPEQIFPVQHTWFRQAEIANMWSHFFAFIASAFAFHALIIKSLALNEQAVFACGVYGTCVLFTFLASTIYHAVTHPRVKEIFHLLDHLLIYLMIAGTYTPFTLITLKDPWGYILFAIIWTLALFGIVFKIFMMGRAHLFSTILYVLMGWMGVIAIVPIIQALPTAGLAWLVAGGVIYTIGVIFYVLESVPFSHTIWHFFVIAGAFCQFVCIYNYVV